MKSYHEANLALAGDNPPFDFHSPDGVIYTRMRFLPASRDQRRHPRSLPDQRRLHHRHRHDIERSVIGVRSHIGKNVTITNSVIIGADGYETDAETRRIIAAACPTSASATARVIERRHHRQGLPHRPQRAIVNQGQNQERRRPQLRHPRRHRRDPKGAIVLDGTVI